MRTRWLAGVAVAILGVGGANAQPAPPAPSTSSSLGPSLPTLPTAPAAPVTPVPAPAAAPPLPPPVPGQLPPLLPVPQPGPPLPEVPRPGGPPIEYDHGYQYLPERAPEQSRFDAMCGPEGRWWVIPSLNLSWASTQPPPGSIRLRVPDPAHPGSTLAGPRLPVAGLDAGRFEAALGLVVGHWFGESNTQGIEASLFIRDANTTFDGSVPGMLVFFPGGVDRSAPQLVTLPAPAASQVVGTFPATLGTFFATVDVNYRQNWMCTQNSRLDVLAGYRYAFLGDELYLGTLPDGSNQAFRLNRAAVSNSFHAGQIGLAGEVRANGWYASGTVKMAFGVMTEDISASGLFVGAQGRSGNGFRRLEALGAPGQSDFAVMPTLDVQVGRQVSRHSRVFVGYSFNYLSRVARLGDVLSPANTGLTLTDFWVQSINFGGEFRF